MRGLTLSVEVAQRQIFQKTICTGTAWYPKTVFAKAPQCQGDICDGEKMRRCCCCAPLGPVQHRFHEACCIAGRGS